MRGTSGNCFSGEAKLQAVDSPVRRAPVESVLSGLEPSNVIKTVWPLDSLTLMVVLKVSDSVADQGKLLQVLVAAPLACSSEG